MIVGIDARMLGPQTGGIGRYTQQLVKELLAIEDETRYVLFLTDDNWDMVPGHPRVQKIKANIPWYGWKEQILFPKVIASVDLDFMHFPHWNVPLLYRGAFVVTVHDLIMFHHPRPDATSLGPMVYAIKDRLHRIILSRAIKKSRAVIVPTQWVKDDIVNTFGTHENHVHVTYEAPLAPFSQEQQDETVISKHNIIEPFAMYVGSGYPHENLKQLVMAWDIAKDEYDLDGQLVFVGGLNRFYAAFAEELEGRADVVFTDFVSDEALAALYAKAQLFVFPSLSEGFGLPALEAMTYGTPVASSQASCMPEVYGEAAIYFDPNSEEHMAEQIYKGMTDEHIRYSLQQRAKEELKRYSWSVMAKQTEEIYRSIHKRSKKSRD
jgi:glycosyltransferase involved in cell wall biosynthesis